MSKNTFDFDQYWEEKNGKPEGKSITIEGHEWPLKSELPAEASLMAMKIREQRDDDDEISIDEITTVYEAIMGKEQVEKLLKTGVGTKKLFGLMQYIMKEVYDFNKEEDEEGNKGNQQGKK